MLRGSCQDQRLCLYLLMFWVFNVYMGLIHCGFGVYLFLTHNLYFSFNLLYILLMLFSLILWFVPMCLCKLLGLMFYAYFCRLYGMYLA